MLLEFNTAKTPSKQGHLAFEAVFPCQISFLNYSKIPHQILPMFVYVEYIEAPIETRSGTYYESDSFDEVGAKPGDFFSWVVKNEASCFMVSKGWFPCTGKSLHSQVEHHV